MSSNIYAIIAHPINFDLKNFFPSISYKRVKGLFRSFGYSEAIATILRDEIYLSSSIATAFFRGFHFYSGQSLRSHPTIHLTERERQVLHWVVQGESNVRISQELNITVGTVKAYLTTIFEKLEVKSRTQAALKALRLGLVCP